ncbi:Ger(x)C family spore germination protein [Halalkalibacter alkaliphilus]|uniref:Ger(X)C family spore germination protein n=1 Tax=Halalkalibacter alkaliphilus TaxID=2917993 RepID=A0A9X2I8Q1_9BACI|nr:Ger(x)C family spore germination protein [Halalkalibacter alkaliphilus]MCL7748315.1 Ger(x)C family spore germination protein [Halalkalibacter alkaliphilus]
MKKLVIIILSVFLLVISGCWDQRELIERAFALGAAIDQHEDQLELTVQFYRPKPEEGGGGDGGDPVSFGIYAQTISEGARNLVNHIGRRANWSHMQVIVIGEETARTRPLSELLGFFYREQEPRSTTHILIGQGKGSDYLNFDPLFEDSSGRQLREIQRFSREVTGHSRETTIHDLSLQLKSELGTAIVPYVTKSANKITTAPIIGVAIVKDDRMVSDLSGKETQSLLILREQFDRANWKLPCKEGNNGGRFDNIEVFLTSSNISPRVNGNQVTVDAAFQFEVTLRELVCETVLETSEDANEFARYIEEQLEINLMNTIEKLQKEKIDASELGNKIYRDNPELWKSVKDNWDELFATAQFNFSISVDIDGSGTVEYRPFP